MKRRPEKEYTLLDNIIQLLLVVVVILILFDL